MMKRVKWFSFIASVLFIVILAGCVEGSSSPASTNDKKDKLTSVQIAEPFHKLSYLPLYVAVDKGFFEGIDVSVLLLSDGSAHTNAVLTGEVWGFIGGVEHNALAHAKGADLKAIINIVNRGDLYFVARTGLEPGTDLAQFIRGKRVVTGAFGRTPNSITRFVLEQLDLEVGTDIELLEVDNTAMASILEQDKGDIAVVSEPILSRGIEAGIWQEPFYKIPDELGPYAYSTVNVSLKTIEEDPETVQAFSDGMVKALAYIRDNREGALEVAKKEFPTLDESLIHATLDRAYADQLWEYSGKIHQESVETAISVVRKAGILTEDVSFDQVVETKFTN